MLARLKTWWTILRITLEERLVYRGDFALGTLMRFLPIVTQIFLWYAVFDAIEGKKLDDSNAAKVVENSSAESPTRSEADTETGSAAASKPSAQSNATAADVAGYTKEDVVAYFLLTMVARAFSSMPGLAGGIAGQIRSGEVKKFLIQPVDMLGFLLLGRIAHKLAYYSVAVAPFALVFFLCRSFFHSVPTDAFTWIMFGYSLIMSFLIGFFIEVTLGLVGFWFLEVSSLIFVYMLLTFFLSGHMFPLDMIGPPESFWRQLVEFLPIKYLAYFPSAVFLGKVTGQELINSLWIQAGWLVFFIALSRAMFYYGVKRYSAFGG